MARLDAFRAASSSFWRAAARSAAGMDSDAQGQWQPQV